MDEQNDNKLRHSLPFSKTLLAILILLTAGFGAALLRTTLAQTGPSGQIPSDNPSKGLVYTGLRKGPANGKCKSLYELPQNNPTESLTCTHGPDPAPPGVDVTKPRSEAQLRAGVSADTTPPTGTVITAGNGSILCDGDGVSGNRVQAIYAVASDKTDRYATIAPMIQTWAAEVDGVFFDSAAKTGGVRHVRWVTDPSCNLVVAHVVLPPTADDSFNSEKSALIGLGYNLTTRKYLVWTDANILCGIANLSVDTNPAQTNSNNGGNTSVLFARVDQGCWGLGTGPGSHMSEAHELSHLLGAVQPAAPHGTPGGHCTDESDTMCYDDGTLKTGQVLTFPCDNTQEHLLDCNDDDYFNTSPAAGSYLANNWDISNNSFLISSSSGPPKVGDINGDGQVNIFDLSVLASNYGSNSATAAQGDLNGDLRVNIFDLSILAAHWGT